jgi:TonB family protein
MMRDGVTRGLLWTFVGSGAAHLVAIIVVAIAASGASHSHKPPQTVLTTKLVRLGKKRDEDLLPRKPTAPPPPPKKAAPVQPPEPDAAPEPARVRSAEDRLKEMSRVSDALNRLKTKKADEEVEGDPEGSPTGEATSITEALARNRYASEIHDCVDAHYEIKGIPRRKVAGKSAVVFVRVREDGRLTDFRVLKSSGLPQVDRAVRDAIKLCGKVSPPAEEFAAELRNEGIEFEFRVD